MIVEDQSHIIAFLAQADVLDEAAGGTPVRRITTHISELFIGGDRVLKLKRAVRFPYLDFSTAALRRAACEAEVAVNRRTAPDLYRGVVAVTREADGRLALGGKGEAVDWLVDMRRFDDSLLFDRLAQEDRLTPEILEDAAAAIATFHAACDQTPAYGGSRAMAENIDNYAASFAEAPAGTFAAVDVECLIEASRRALERLAPLLEERRRQGRVRHGHGDLHLRNVTLIDGTPTLFDAIEFSPGIANVDVLFDIAFLLMDLDHRSLRAEANLVFNRYLDVAAIAERCGSGSSFAGDDEGLAALPLFLSQRAAIRAHVTGAAAAAAAAGQGARLVEEARDYLGRAVAYLAPSPPLLVAVGGLSGTGKSQLARELAGDIGAAPGARLVRSDVPRKRLAGLDAFATLDAGGYTREMTERTFAAVAHAASATLAGGHAVVADAVYAEPAQRRAVEAVAARSGVPFVGFWLEAPLDVRLARAGCRGRDASDAGAPVVRRQEDYETGPVAWCRVDAGGTPESTLCQARARLADACGAIAKNP